LQYKLIVTDMDGTLLNNEKEVSQANQEALKKAREMGVKVVIATGRIYTSAKMYAQLLGIDTPIIACNGAIIKRAGCDEVIQSSPFKKEDLLNLVKILEGFGVYYHFYGQHHFYTKELKYTSEHYAKLNVKVPKDQQISIKIVENPMDQLLSDEIDDEILKFTIIDENIEKLRSIRAEVDRVEGLITDKSWHNNIEVMAKGTSKGNALDTLAKMMDINKEEIICFGDNENDLSLFDSSGFKVAMENGEDALKRRADYITSSNDQDGVAKAIYQFILSK
jgi:Cof subfamily protein (haloacid dehalogenase superfamily)